MMRKIVNFGIILICIYFIRCTGKKYHTELMEEGYYSSELEQQNKETSIFMNLLNSLPSEIVITAKGINDSLEIQKYIFTKKYDTIFLLNEFEDNVYKYLLKVKGKELVMKTLPNLNDSLFNLKVKELSFKKIEE